MNLFSNQSGGTSRLFVQPSIARPLHVVIVGVLGMIGAWFMLTLQAEARGGLRFSFPVSIALSFSVIALAVVAFIRIQHRVFDLMQHPNYWPRLAGVLVRMYIFGGPIFFVFLLQSNSGVMGSLPLLFMLNAMYVGMSVAQAGAVRRVGDGLYCAQCGYECRTSSEQCSECGFPWREPSGLLRGQRVQQRGAMVVGMVVALLGMSFGMPTPFGIDRLGMYLLPDSLRIRFVTTGPTWSSEERLQDLLQSKLTVEEEEQLALCLLDQRVEEQRLSSTAITWLEKKVLSPGVSAEISDRFLNESAEFALEGPTTVEVGKPFKLLIAVEARDQALGSTLNANVYIGGVSTDGGKTYQGRSDYMGRPGMVADVWHFLGSRNLHDRSGRLPKLEIDEPGRHEIQVLLWVSILNGLAPTYSPEWKDDGTPKFPANTVTTKRIVLRHSVLVSEAQDGS